MALISTLYDTFSGTSLDTSKWTATGTASVSSGRLGVTHAVAAGTNNVISVNGYTLAGSSIMGEVALGSNADGATDCYTSVRLIGTTTTNYIHIFWRNRAADPRVYFQLFTAGVEDNNPLGTGDTNLVMDATMITATRFYKVAEASGTITFSTSSDGTTWTQRRTLPTPSWVTSDTGVKVRFTGLKSSGTTAVSYFDNVNPAYSPPPTGGNETFAQALQKFVDDGSLVSYWPLNNEYQLQDVFGGHNLTQKIKTGSGSGPVTFDSTGAYFNGKNYLEAADHNDFSLTTTSELSIIISVDPDSFSSGGVNAGTWRTSGTGSDTDFYKHWAGKGTAGQHEWTFRHYALDVPSILSDRPAAISHYHYTAAGNLGVGNRINRQDLENGYINLANVFDQDSPTHATYPGSCSLYTQGVHRGTTNFNASYAQIVPSNTTSPVTFGTRGDFSGWLVGKIRRVAIFNRKLLPQEISDIQAAQGRPEGSWGEEGSPSSTFFSTLHDAFATALDPAWTTTTGTTVVSGQARIATSTTPLNQISTGHLYTLKDSRITFQMGPVVDTTGGTEADTYTRARITTAATPTTMVDFLLRPAEELLHFRHIILDSSQAAAAGSVASVTYDPNEHVWFRFEESAGSVTWQTSRDGSTWVTHRTIATPAWIGTTSDQRFAVNAVKSTGATSYAVVDNVNASPFSNLTDSFDSQDITKWTWKGGASVATGTAVIRPIGLSTENYANGFNSKQTYYLDDGDAGFTLRVAGLPSAGARLSIDLASALPIATGSPAYVTKAAGWFIDQTGSTAPSIEANYWVGGVATSVGTFTRKAWLNIRRNGSNVEWRMSDDGITWGSPVATVAVASLPALDALFAIVRARPSSATAVTGGYLIDDVGAVPTVPAAPANLSAVPDVASVELTWDASTATEFPVDAYRVTWLPGGSTPIPLGAAAVNYTATGLTPGTLYTFSLEAHNANGWGAASTDTATPLYPPVEEPDDPPSEPLSIIVTAGAASVLVSWTTPTSPNGTISGYRVVDQQGTTRGVVTGTGTSTTVTGLYDGVTYYFRVYASNENGESQPSQWSDPFTPWPSGTSTGPLVERASFGAWPETSYAATEELTGRALQPVVYRHVLGTAFPTSTIDDLGLRDRHALLLLDTTGIPTQSILDGGYDTVLEKFTAAATKLGRFVYVAPLPIGNDAIQVWSPQYTSTLPWFDPDLSGRTGTVHNYIDAFVYIARRLRASQYIRTVWSFSVDPQPDPAAEDMDAYYPGPAADICMLVGYNYGIGPEQGKAGLTEWLTPSQVFDAPYAAATALIPATTPVWLWTGCHEPSAPFVPTGPGFPPDSLVQADLAHDKAAWVDLLLGSLTWPRVQAVIWNDTSGERDWRINSSTESADAFYGQLGDSDDWVRTQVTQDRLGDHVRKLVSNIAKWARGGAAPAIRTNEYERPDARSGVRVSITHVSPYSAGTKRTTTISTADMANWNRLHGLMLRQSARYGIQGWAYASGALPANETALLHPGTATASGVTLSDSADALPGPQMQQEGGMKTAAGS